MGARILDLASARMKRQTYGVAPAREQTCPPAHAGFGERFHFWRGASGRSYVHTVYTLLGCPELPPANVVLVRRDQRGSREALEVTRVTNDAPSLNLAAIRQRGATLGANEVHVHLLAPSAEAARLVEFDLASTLDDPLPPIPHNANDRGVPA